MMINKQIIDKPLTRYLVVGGAAAISEYGSFLLLFMVFNVWLWLANAVSYALGLLTSFWLNRLWVFRHKQKVYQKKLNHQFVLYVTMASVNLFLTLLIVAYLKHLGVKPVVGKLLAMAITSIWNFIIFRSFIFMHQDTPKSVKEL